MRSRLKRISDDMDQVLIAFKHYYDKKLNTKSTYVKASKVLAEALKELDFENIYLRKGKVNGRIKKHKIDKIKFRTTGCAAAIATSSVLTDLAKDRKITDALKLKNKDVVDALDGMPLIKVHCSILAIDALHEAVYDYYKKLYKEQFP